MKTPLTPALRFFGTVAVTVIGVAFFFAIIGVFGLPIAIGSLALFIVLAFLTFRCHQAGEIRL
jgi:hypothetical protein